jgi:hypothetical protein
MSNFLENIPLVIFSLLFLLVFVIFLIGSFFILTAKGDSQKIKKGKNFLRDSLYGLFIVLLIVLVSLLVTYLLKGGERLKPSSSAGEFPPSPSANYPSPPQFIKIGGFYFNGPRVLRGNNFVAIPILYSVLCKKDSGYDIIYIGDTKKTEKAVDLLKNKQYNCWIEHCGKKFENLYIAFRVLGKGQESEGGKIRQTLENQVNPVCGMPDSSVKSNNNNGNNE